MANNTLQISEDIAFVFGMNWSTLEALESRSGEIASIRERGGKFKASYKNKGEENFGWVRDVDQPAKNVKLLSGAGQVAVHPDFIGKTVLVLIEDEGEDGNPGMVAAVGLINGNVIVDELLNATEIAKLRESFHDRCANLSQTFKTVGNAISIDEVDDQLDWLDLAPKKLSRFKTTPQVAIVPLRSAIPVPNAGAAVAIVVVLVAVYMAFDWYQTSQKDKRNASVKQELTPEELYAASASAYLLVPQILAKDALPTIRKYIGDIPVTFAGWELKNINCGTSACTLNWARDFGTFAEFKERAPANWTGITFSDNAQMIAAQVLIELPKTLLPQRSTWPSREDFKVEQISKWQRYTDIGLHTSLEKTMLHAVPPGVSAAAIENSPIAIKAAEWTVAPGSKWYASSSFDDVPLYVTYDSLVLTVEATDTSFEAKGKVYVKN